MAICAIVVLAVAGCASTTNGTGAPASPLASTSSTSASASPSASVSASPSAVTRPVHVSLLEGDGGTYGVGMPIVAYFSQNITGSAAFIKATTVTVNGAHAGGAWYFEANGDPTKPMAAHYRPQNYWPADSTIKMNMPVQGLSAGTGLAFDDSLTLSISIGDAHVSDGRLRRRTDDRHVQRRRRARPVPDVLRRAEHADRDRHQGRHAAG